jgi:tetratricopeptide (TPR) repeat protein
MPDSALALEPAFAAFRAGDFVRVELLSRPLLALAPNDPNLLTLMAISVHELGRPGEALPYYRRLTEIDPDAAEHWGNLGTVLRECGRAEEAEASYLRAIRLNPDDPQHRVNLGLLLGEIGNAGGARTAMLDAVELDPRLLDARIFGSLACFECGDARNAERLIEGNQHWRNQLPLELLLQLGRATLQLGHEADSAAILARAQAIAPNDITVRIWHVQMLERLNRLDEAQAAADALPDPDRMPNRALADEIVGARATVAARDRHPEHARTLLERLAALPSPSPQVSASVHFSLAKVLDKLGDVDATMAALEVAHAAQMVTARTLVPDMFEPGAEPLKIAAVRMTPAEAAWPRDDGPDEAHSPVFIMGFPRSGTTLLEQMLDAHPAFRSMDERTFIQGAVERMERMGLAHPQQLGELTASQLDSLRELYWQQVSTAVHIEPGQRLVDKNPLNMLRLPIAARMFPRAPIILALRHPCDVLLSNYLQNFRSPSFMVLCASLEKLARSYVNAMQFWIHHEKVLGARIFHLRYEDMLDDVEGHLDRIGAFLGIDDARSMLGFGERAREKGFISTPSYAQVIEPINKRSVGKWRRYERYFADALPILKPVMEHWGYDA